MSHSKPREVTRSVPIIKIEDSNDYTDDKEQYPKLVKQSDSDSNGSDDESDDDESYVEVREVEEDEIPVEVPDTESSPLVRG